MLSHIFVQSYSIAVFLLLRSSMSSFPSHRRYSIANVLCFESKGPVFAHQHHHCRRHKGNDITHIFNVVLLVFCAVLKMRQASKPLLRIWHSVGCLLAYEVNILSLGHAILRSHVLCIFIINA